VNLSKLLTLAIWILGIGAFFCPVPSMAITVLRATVVFLTVAHLIEIALFWKILKNAPGSLPAHVFNTFLFGVFYVGPLKKAQQRPLP
jgi:uncharacterized protein YhhL (DUF1145 family)